MPWCISTTHATGVHGDNTEDCAKNTSFQWSPDRQLLRCQSSPIFPGILILLNLGCIPHRQGRRPALCGALLLRHRNCASSGESLCKIEASSSVCSFSCCTCSDMNPGAGQAPSPVLSLFLYRGSLLPLMQIISCK